MNQPGEKSVAGVKKKADSFFFRKKDFDKFAFNFLAVLFCLKYKSNTINLNRSTISVYDEDLDSPPMSKNSKIKNLITGIYNKSPAKPKICFYLGFRSSS